MNPLFKFIDWSYPTSPNAEKFGFAQRGCWTLKVGVLPYAAPVAVAGFADAHDAVRAAQKIKAPWHSFMKTKHVPSGVRIACENLGEAI